MSQSNKTKIASYCTLAQQLFDNKELEEQLDALTKPLSLLTDDILAAVVAEADDETLSRPRLTWALTAVCHAAAQHLPHPNRDETRFLQGRAAFELARGCNAWLQPQRVETAVAAAETHFQALNDEGWLAACAWQRNAVPWMVNNFPQAAAELEEALATLPAHNLHQYIPDCRFSLAHAHILIGNFATATELIEINEQYFIQANNPLGQWYCAILHLSNYRRQSKANLAIKQLKIAYTIASQFNASVYSGLLLFHHAYLNAYVSGDLPESIVLFQKAISHFQEADLSLMIAQCHNGLYQIYSDLGLLQKAEASLLTAKNLYKPYQIVGLLADNFLEHGHLSIYLNEYQAALNYFNQAEQLYKQHGNVWTLSIIWMNKGEIYLYLGQYERAIALLEKAQSSFENLKLIQQSIECKLRLASTWIFLGQYKAATQYLNDIVTDNKNAIAENYFASAYYFQAIIHYKQANYTECIDSLETTLILLESQALKPQIALAQRLLAETFLKINSFARAQGSLQNAEKNFQEMGMRLEELMCQLVWGHYYKQTHEDELAQHAWETLITQSDHLLPDIAWQVYAALAASTLELGKNQLALEYFGQMIDQLNKLRQHLWQPTLIHSFLQKPNQAIDQAVCLAAALKRPEKLLLFMEQVKAQRISQQLEKSKKSRPSFVGNENLLALKGEIRWLYEQLRVTLGASLLTERKNQADLIKELNVKLKQLEQFVGQEQRAFYLDQEVSFLSNDFQLSSFQQLATVKMGQKWLALNYYLTSEQLSGVLVTSTTLYSWTERLTEEAKTLLQRLTYVQNRQLNLSNVDWVPLVKLLFPQTVLQHLREDTVLLIAPHRQLHQIPWAILPIDNQETPLVMYAVPSIIPSLNSLIQIWQRSHTEFSITKPSLVLAVSEFPSESEDIGRANLQESKQEARNNLYKLAKSNRHPTLPNAITEANTISQYLPNNSQILINNAVNSEELTKLQQAMAIENFSLLHIISHAFHDGIVGYTSNIALYDRDIWLDELEALAPLPPLVTLSVCTGGQQRYYEGNEAIGLPTSCLIAGAQSVIGALTLVSDMLDSPIMANFYEQLFRTGQVAKSLAIAQRNAWQNGKDIGDWGVFQCVGSP